MALSKQRKSAIVSDVAQLLSQSKLTVIARYQGTSVQSLQDLRRQARDSHTQVRVIKNRLVKKAIEADDKLKQIETDFLTGQLMYAFNDEDELAPAQVLAKFAKNEPQIEFVAALTADGELMPADDVKALAALPTKEQLRGQLAGVIAAPISGFSSVMAANVRNVLNVLHARAEASK